MSFTKSLQAASLLLATSWLHCTPSVHAEGTLRVHPTNPRYFSDDSGKAIYLTGSHTWDSLQDFNTTFDYTEYLDFMKGMDNNFMRMWAWETPKGTPWSKQNKLATIDPTPFRRTGPGLAEDGNPKYDLTQFNQAYFDRLRARVIEAKDRDIFVSVMLFQGFSVEHGSGNNPWRYHPMDSGNNINGIAGNTNNDNEGKEVHTLGNASVTAIQEEYVKKVIDTVNDLDNVLYEISNESGSHSTSWQYHMIHFIQSYETSQKPKQHPVGMTYQLKGGTNAALFNSPADWISPNGAEGYKNSPPDSTGNKVIIVDTDHTGGIFGTREVFWKYFLSGMNSAYMDTYRGTILSLADWNRGHTAEDQVQVRDAMRDTRRFAQKMNLTAMTPQRGLVDGGNVLAATGKEYLVRAENQSFHLNVESGTYDFEWFDQTVSEVHSTGTVTVPGGAFLFDAPKQHMILYLKREGLDLGNYDGDYDVDGSDFLVWQRGDSPNGTQSGDFSQWQTHFGSAASIAASHAAVPEPTSLVLCLGAIALLCQVR